MQIGPLDIQAVERGSFSLIVQFTTKSKVTNEGRLVFIGPLEMMVRNNFG